MARQETVGAGGPAPAARWLPPAVAVGVPTAAVGVHALLYGRWIVDDAAITFAYARSTYPGAQGGLRLGKWLMRRLIDKEIRLDVNVLECLASHDP